MIVLFLQKNLQFFLFGPQMGPPTHGGWAGAARSTSTGGAQDLAFRNVPVASTGTALTPNMTATVMPTSYNCKSAYHINFKQEQNQLLMY